MTDEFGFRKRRAIRGLLNKFPKKRETTIWSANIQASGTLLRAISLRAAPRKFATKAAASALEDSAFTSILRTRSGDWAKEPSASVMATSSTCTITLQRKTPTKGRCEFTLPCTTQWGVPGLTTI